MCRLQMMFGPVLLFMGCLFMSTLLTQAHGQQYPQYPKSVDPFEVIVYEHKDFTGYYQSFKLDPTKRQKLVPFLDKSIEGKISSIQVGQKVGVILFNHPKFQDFSLGSPDSVLRHYYEDSVSSLAYPASSLIVYHKEMGPVGIVLRNKPSGVSDQNSRLYPLLEDWSESRLCYKSLQDLDGESEFVMTYPRAKNSPAYGKVYVTLFDKPNCQGKWLTLPGAGEYSNFFKLNNYDWDEKAHSLEVRWEGQIPTVLVPGQISGLAKVAPSEAHVKAPEAPTKTRAPAAPDLEKGLDRPGSDYKNFALDGGPEQCQQACTSDANCRAFTWVRPGLQGSQAQCWLKSGVPVSVANGNCVSGVKTTQTTAQTSSSTPSPLLSSTVKLQGTWKSSIGQVYEVRQRGEQFGWSVANSDEKGRGTCQGMAVSASWSGSAGTGSAKGNVTSVDASGKAARIEWDNGVIFFR